MDGDWRLMVWELGLNFEVAFLRNARSLMDKLKEREAWGHHCWWTIVAWMLRSCVYLSEVIYRAITVKILLVILDTNVTFHEMNIWFSI